MASSAVIALISAGALTAAQAQDTAVPTEPVATSELVASQEVLTPEEPTFATAYIGKSVYSSEDPESENIGDINDLILSEDGSITHAVVGVGGFLGIGEKNVAVPFDELKLVERDGDIRFVYASTREQLEAAPALDRAAFDPPRSRPLPPRQAPMRWRRSRKSPAQTWQRLRPRNRLRRLRSRLPRHPSTSRRLP
jgi:hypothetical protein